MDKTVSAFKKLIYSTLVTAQQELTVSQLPAAMQADIKRRDSELHPSSLPICPLRESYNRHLRPTDFPVYNTFGQDYFLNVGTLTHEILQRWVGASGKIVGNWSCAACKAKYPFCTRPAGCKKCGGDSLNYHELGGKDGNVSWHTDGLFLKSNKYILFDYKTTGEKQLIDHEKTGKVFPYSANCFQLEAYVPLIARKYNISIDYYALVYISRSRPNAPNGHYIHVQEVNESLVEKWAERLERFKEAHALALQVNEKPVQVFREAMRTKICEDEEFYKSKVHVFYNECPLAKNGVCFDRKKLVKEIKSVI